MSILKSTPAFDALLAMIGVASEEELFTEFGRAVDSPIGVVNVKIWKALDDYSLGEQSFRENVIKTANESTQQLGYIDRGQTPDASWFIDYANKAAAAQAKMSEALNVLHGLVAIRKAMRLAAWVVA